MPDIKITEQEPIKFLINDSYEQLNRSLKQVPIDDGYYHQNNIEQLALCDKVKEEVLISGIEAGKYLTSKFNAKPYEIDLWFSKYFSPFEHCKSEKNEVLYTTHKEVGTHYKYDYKKIDIEKFTPGEMYRLISFTDLIARPLWELDVHTSIQILDKARINRNLQVMRRDNCYIDLTDTDFYGDSAKNLLFSQEKLIKSNNTKETKDSFKIKGIQRLLLDLNKEHTQETATLILDSIDPVKKLMEQGASTKDAKKILRDMEAIFLVSEIEKIEEECFIKPEAKIKKEAYDLIITEENKNKKSPGQVVTERLFTQALTECNIKGIKNPTQDRLAKEVISLATKEGTWTQDQYKSSSVKKFIPTKKLRKDFLKST